MPATAAHADIQGASLTGDPPRKIYRASSGRRTIFSFVFLILLPFFLSLPGMLFMRLKHGHVADAIELALFAVAFGIVMFLLLIELMFSVRAKVDLGPEKVRMTLPSGRGPTPMLRYATYDVPYDQIQSIETRREVYGGAALPVLLKGARLSMKDGSHIKLGYVSDANIDPTFPYPDIAKEIGQRARLPVIDRGNVRRSFRNKYLGLRASNFGERGKEPGIIEEKDIAALNHSHASMMFVFIGGLVVLIALGIVADITAREPVSRMPVPASANPAKPGNPAAPAPASKPLTEPKPKQ